MKRYVVTERRLEKAKRWMARSEWRDFVRLLKLVTKEEGQPVPALKWKP